MIGSSAPTDLLAQWPGYRSWTKQIPAKDFKKVPSPITREKLAKEVAKCVKRFIEVCPLLDVFDDGG